MRARNQISKKDAERVAEDVSAEMIECLQNEIAVGIIAVIRHFKLGKKRTQEFVKFLEETKSEFSKHNDDGILFEKIEEELKYRDIDIATIYERPLPIRRATQAIKIKKQHKISIADAHKISSELDKMQEFLQHSEKQQNPPDLSTPKLRW